MGTVYKRSKIKGQRSICRGKVQVKKVNLPYTGWMCTGNPVLVKNWD